MKKSLRESNIELLRIFCTLMIIASHFLGIGHVSQKEPFLYLFIYQMLSSLSRVACSVFIIICAWFSIDKPFDISKIFHVWLVTVMFMIPFVFGGHHYKLYAKDLNILLYSMMPISYGYGASWFSSVYIVLMLFSPFLNYLLRHMERGKLKIFVISYICTLSIFGTIFHENGKYGLELVAFVFIYLLTGYIKKYGIYKGSMPKSREAISIFFVSWLGITALMSIGIHRAGNPICDEIYRYGYFYYGYFQTIPNLLCAFSLFFVFYNLTIKRNAIINRLASASFGIIIFHNIPEWNSYFYTNILYCTWHARNLKDLSLLLYSFLGIMVIFIMGFFFETIRGAISDFLIEKRAWYRTICICINKYYSGDWEIDTKMSVTIALPIVFYCITIHFVFWMKSNGIETIKVIPFLGLGVGCIVISVSKMYKCMRRLLLSESDARKSM